MLLSHWPTVEQTIGVDAGSSVDVEVTVVDAAVDATAEAALGDRERPGHSFISLKTNTLYLLSPSNASHGC